MSIIQTVALRDAKAFIEMEEIVIDREFHQKAKKKKSDGVKKKEKIKKSLTKLKRYDRIQSVKFDKGLYADL